jgi:hypothetical protein
MPRVDTGKPNGRPTKKNAQAIARILKVARTGLPLKFAAQAGDIDAETLAQWRAKDPEFDRALSQARLAAVEEKWKQIQKAAQDRLDADGNLIKAGDWKCLAWSLERAYPAEFARPEVALNLAMQNNVTQNFLSISITGEEVRAIESQADPVRQSVHAMFVSYRPQVLGNGDKAKPIDVEAEKVRDEPPIERRPGDENRAEFWAQFTSNRDRAVEASTAVFVVTTIVGQVIGAHRGGKVEFKGPVSVGDCLDRIDQLVGVGSAAGWQRIQKKAGY